MWFIELYQCKKMSKESKRSEGLLFQVFDKFLLILLNKKTCIPVAIQYLYV